MDKALVEYFDNLFSGFHLPSFGQIVMILIGAYLIYQAVYYNKKALLLLPMGVSIIASNIPLPYTTENILLSFFSFIQKGTNTSLYSVLVFFAVGTMIDLGLVLADPKNFFIGASSQIGIFLVFYIMSLFGFSDNLSAGISIIGAADGALSMYIAPIVLSSKYFTPIVLASFLYMGILPDIQSFITKCITTEKERKISMNYLRHVSRGEKIIFAVVAMALCGILLPHSFPLVVALMFGSILRESKIIDTFSNNIQKALNGILTILIGIAIGGSTTAYNILVPSTLFIFLFGFLALILSTIIGILTAKIINIITGGKVNPIIGSAGLSAFPIPAWGAHVYGQENMSSNCLLLHAMAVNISGIISSMITVGILIAFLH